jgi:hypothetical protein
MEESGSGQINTDPDPGGPKVTDPEHGARIYRPVSAKTSPKLGSINSGTGFNHTSLHVKYIFLFGRLAWSF